MPKGVTKSGLRKNVLRLTDSDRQFIKSILVDQINAQTARINEAEDPATAMEIVKSMQRITDLHSKFEEAEKYTPVTGKGEEKKEEEESPYDAAVASG